MPREASVSSVSAHPYSGTGCFFKKVSSPETWSECSCVTRMPTQSLTARPRDFSAVRVVRQLLPMSISRYLSSLRISAQLPEEPEYRVVKYAIRLS